MRPRRIRRGWRKLRICPAGGFTLIELLVVCSIIGVLAALTAAAVHTAKQKGNNAVCFSNLHQHGLALLQFVSVHHEYPLAINYGFYQGRYVDHYTSWLKALYPDTLRSMRGDDGKDDRGVLDCPSASRPTAIPAGIGYADYGYNYEGLVGPVAGQPLGIGWDVSETAERMPVKETEVSSPSALVTMGDGIQGWDGVFADGQLAIGRVFSVIELYGSTARTKRRHSGRANILMCDGHVEGQSLSFLFGDRSDKALSQWNRDGKPHRERLGP